MGRGRRDRSQDPQDPARWEAPDSQLEETADALEASWMGREQPSLGTPGKGCWVSHLQAASGSWRSSGFSPV